MRQRLRSPFGRLLGLGLCALLGACSSVPSSEDPRIAAPAPAGLAEGTGALLEDFQLAVNRSRALTAADALTLPSERPMFVDVWARLRVRMTWGRRPHPRVQRELDWLLRNPGYVRRVGERSRFYVAHIVRELERHRLPSELALVPAVESAFQPRARSHAGAGGIWQFIPATARRFGLRRDEHYDGRFDVVDSTDAAIAYFKELGRIFEGDWLLALAGYNAGEGRVRAAMAANRRRGRPTDFWSLQLPAETMRYVPRVVAFARLVAYANELAVKLPRFDDSPYFQVVEFDTALDIRAMARALGMTRRQTLALNAGFLGATTGPRGPHRMLVPRETAAAMTTPS